jgi:hypothetical protein
MAPTQPPPTEIQMLTALARGDVMLRPLEVTSVEREPTDRNLDAKVQVRCNGKRYTLAVQCKSSYFPKSIDDATEQARRGAASLKRRAVPTILVPYLSDEQLDRLEQQQVSGIDLCGNGLVMVPGEFLVRRSGQPNRFPREGIIKNVYRGTSALVSRTFLLDRQFDSLRDVQSAIADRQGAATLATISKVISSLEKDLIVDRQKNRPARTQRFRVIQPDKLLDRLSANFVMPAVNDRVAGKLRTSLERLGKWAREWESTTRERLVRTGADSVDQYATMAREAVRTFYCTNVATLRKDLGGDFTATDRFAEVEFRQTEDDAAYFDRRAGLAGSPIQTYLELMAGDKRDQETAAQVRRLLLNTARK